MTYDIIDKPPHYSDGRAIEAIEVIEDWKLNFHMGNAVKYICRAGHKDYCGSLDLSTIADLDKAIWYIVRHRNQLARMVEQRQVKVVDI